MAKKYDRGVITTLVFTAFMCPQWELVTGTAAICTRGDGIGRPLTRPAGRGRYRPEFGNLVGMSGLWRRRAWCSISQNLTAWASAHARPYFPIPTKDVMSTPQTSRRTVLK